VSEWVLKCWRGGEREWERVRERENEREWERERITGGWKKCLLEKGYLKLIRLDCALAGERRREWKFLFQLFSNFHRVSNQKKKLFIFHFLSFSFVLRLETPSDICVWLNCFDKNSFLCSYFYLLKLCKSFRKTVTKLIKFNRGEEEKKNRPKTFSLGQVCFDVKKEKKNIYRSVKRGRLFEGYPPWRPHSSPSTASSTTSTTTTTTSRPTARWTSCTTRIWFRAEVQTRRCPRRHSLPSRCQCHQPLFASPKPRTNKLKCTPKKRIFSLV